MIPPDHAATTVGLPSQREASLHPRRATVRVPTLPAAAAVATGIVLDRFFDPPLMIAFAIAMAATVAAVGWRSRANFSALCILIAMAGIGAIRHHTFWTTRPPGDISLINLADEAPVRLVGVVESPIDIRQAESSSSTPAWMRMDRSSFNLAAERLIGREDLPVTGLVRIDVNGHVLDVAIGDRIEVLGHIRIPGEPRDPEGFDMRLWLRSQGIDRAISVEHPAAVVRIEDASTIWHRIARWRQRCRRECEELLAVNLSDRGRAVGTSLLLGTRTGLTEDIRDAFIHSGTMHLLAISGLHVGILAGCVLMLCRLLNVSTGSMIAIVLSVLWAYAFVTDLRPPVLRSAVLGCLMAAAVPRARNVSGFNLLCSTALLMLLWNPVDLFDLGAQLSFLAVAGILWSTRYIAVWKRRRNSILLDSDLTRWQRFRKRSRIWIVEGYVVTAAIWLFTLPLTLAWFHLFSPIGFLINVALVPFSIPLLVTGFATLAVGLLIPAIAWVPAAGYDLCLRVLMVVVEWAAGTPFGHVAAPGPATWQLWIFYGLLAAAILVPAAGWRRRSWQALAVSVALMLIWAVRPHASRDLVVTFLDVGHGGAVLFEFPGGETALFDAGSFGRGDAAELTIERALQARRIAGLNALILSHADSDHYNAAAGLLERMPVGAVYVSQAFPDPAQWGISELCEAVVRRKIPLRFVQAGDVFPLADDCRLQVLHPAGGFRDKLDNAHSIVLRADYAGRIVLVTGDVEKAGVRALMESHPAERIDIFQAPHHGGKMSNTTDLARWALPRFVVACNRDDAVLPRLREVYADAERILTSASNGTVVATIHSGGEVELITLRKAPQ